MNAVERIRPKLSSWAAAFRGFWRLESIVELRRRRRCLVGWYAPSEDRLDLGTERFVEEE